MGSITQRSNYLPGELVIVKSFVATVKSFPILISHTMKLLLSSFIVLVIAVSLSAADCGHSHDGHGHDHHHHHHEHAHHDHEEPNPSFKYSRQANDPPAVKKPEAAPLHQHHDHDDHHHGHSHDAKKKPAQLGEK